jgi:hypothetical protein
MADTPNVQVPKGYEESTSDLVGFWNPEEGPIHFIPKIARLFDSSIDASKPSCLIMGELVDDCPNLINGDKEKVLGRKGDEVGVWYKPGMRAIKRKAGLKCYVYANGELDTGKPNAMQMFSVNAPKNGQGMNIPAEDMRKLSKPQAGSEGMLDEIPF